ncbi:MAG: lysophospholipid acyltransferase family protein [Gemmataceae bacterium]
MTPPPPPDRTTLPLLRAAALVGLALTAWPAFAADPPRWAWLAAFAAGVGVTFVYRHPFHTLGYVPYGLTLGAGAAVVARFWGWGEVSAGFAGFGMGLAAGALLEPRPAARLADAPGWGVGLCYWAAALLGVLPVVAVRAGWADADRLRGTFTLGAVVALLPGAALAWARLMRPLVELSVVPLLSLSYRIRVTGPGLADFPRTGACVVIANHACWFDPVFLGRVLPRPITPMMTSEFYDLPGIRWLMVHVFGTIRVPEKQMKKETPAEIVEAIAALDRGDCLVLFPEGYLRRTDDRPMRRFGRGIWHILAARPDVPVYACWIEGAWGSFTSYRGGRPTKNKRPDVFRSIAVGVPLPETIPAAELETHLTTRLGLMNRVAAARALLGLPPLPEYELPERGDDKDEG